MSQDPKETGERNLDFVGYDVSGDGMNFKTLTEKLDWMENKNNLGVKTVASNRVDDVEKIIKGWLDARPTLDYGIDGIVFAADDLNEWEDAGWTGKCPNASVAYKFPAEQKEARVLNIEWQVARTGKLTPVAKIEPTLIDGSTVSNITLHNWRNVIDKNIHIGCTVLFEKAGDIIPSCIRVTKMVVNDVELVKRRSELINLPRTCPSCGGPVLTDANEVNIVCGGVECPAQLVSRLLNWLRTLDVKGVGDGTVEAMVGAGLVKGIKDLYYLDPNDIAKLPGFASKSAMQVVQAILGKNEIPLGTFLHALGIDGLGNSTGNAIAAKYKTLEKTRETSVMGLMEIEGIGEKTAKAIWNGLVQNADLIVELDKILTVQAVEGPKNGPLNGMVVVATGAMPSGIKRDALYKFIRDNGGLTTDNINRQVTHLVQSDPNSTSSKSEKAKKMGCKIIGEDEVYKMAGKRP